MASHRTLIAMGVLACAACARSHLEERFGESNRAIAVAQRVNAQPKAQAVSGLDSQEAAIISKHYRDTLTPKGSETGGIQPILMVAPPSRERASALPLPSVPKE